MGSTGLGDINRNHCCLDMIHGARIGVGCKRGSALLTNRINNMMVYKNIFGLNEKMMGKRHNLEFNLFSGYSRYTKKISGSGLTEREFLVPART